MEGNYLSSLPPLAWPGLDVGPSKQPIEDFSLEISHQFSVGLEIFNWTNSAQPSPVQTILSLHQLSEVRNDRKHSSWAGGHSISIVLSPWSLGLVRISHPSDKYPASDTFLCHLISPVEVLRPPIHSRAILPGLNMMVRLRSRGTRLQFFSNWTWQVSEASEGSFPGDSVEIVEIVERERERLVLTNSGNVKSLGWT